MDFKNVIWITGDQNCTALIFRREFSIRSVKEAKISICGLGFFELYLNGKKVSDDLFVPVWTNYEKRENRRLLYPLQDELSNYRTYYLEYDVSSYLNEGVNTIGVMLGNGWYHQVRRTEEGDLDYGFPKLCFELLITDQAGQTLQFYSDSEMKWSESEIFENNLFFGKCTTCVKNRMAGCCQDLTTVHGNLRVRCLLRKPTFTGRIVRPIR